MQTELLAWLRSAREFVPGVLATAFVVVVYGVRSFNDARDGADLGGVAVPVPPNNGLAIDSILLAVFVALIAGCFYRFHHVRVERDETRAKVLSLEQARYALTALSAFIESGHGLAEPLNEYPNDADIAAAVHYSHFDQWEVLAHTSLLKFKKEWAEHFRMLRADDHPPRTMVDLRKWIRVKLDRLDSIVREVENSMRQ
jgi:predicted secreted protein